MSPPGLAATLAFPGGENFDSDYPARQLFNCSTRNFIDHWLWRSRYEAGLEQLCCNHQQQRIDIPDHYADKYAQPISESKSHSDSDSHPKSNPRFDADHGCRKHHSYG